MTCKFISLFLILNSSIFSMELIAGLNKFPGLDLNGSMQTFVDTHAVWDWAQLLEEDKLWNTSVKGNLLSGGSTGYAHWYKIEVDYNVDNHRLFFSDPLLDTIDVYFVCDSTLVRHSRSGSNFKFDQRELDVSFISFLVPEGVQTLYIRLKHEASFQFPLIVIPLKEFIKKGRTYNLLLGLYFGVLLFLMLYNFFIYLSLKDKTYLYYIFYLFFLIIVNATVKGISFQYVWPNVPQLNSFNSSYAALVLLFMALFVMSLLQIKTHLPKLKSGFYVFIGSFVLVIITDLISKQISSLLIQSVSVFFAIFLIIVSVYSYRKGDRVGQFFLFAWGFYMLMVILFIAQNNGFVLSSLFTRNAVFVGSFIEAILFSFLMAYRIKILRRDKEIAQQREIKLQIDKQGILESQAIELQIKVDDATSKLKRYQSDLVQSEKMNSLGRMAAGVAHEINSSIHVSGTSISIIDRNIGFLRNCLRQFETTDLNHSTISCKLEVEKTFRAQMNKILNDLAVSVSKAELGIKRTVKITEGLNYFSKVGASTAVISTDINRDISSMLTLQRSILSESIQIDMNLGKIPNLYCKAKDLNQAFLSIFDNAVLAINEKPLPGRGTIQIDTKVVDDHVIISFKDDGVGINDKVLDRIFEPFFTTRPFISKGLGLSSAYGTVKEHRGEVTVESKEGKGSVFTIVLPLN